MSWNEFQYLMHRGPGYYGQCPFCQSGQIVMRPMANHPAFYVWCSVCTFENHALTENVIMDLSLNGGVLI